MAWLTLAAPLGAEVRFEDRRDALPGPPQVYSGGWEHFVGGGVAVMDCNGDGRPDIFAAGGSTPSRLWVNAGDWRFREAQVAAGEGVVGAYPLDVDGDGAIDLAVLRVGPDLMLRGDGGCGFAPGAWDIPARDAWSTAFSATWNGAWPTLAFGAYVDRHDPEGPFFACEDNLLLRPRATMAGATAPSDGVPPAGGERAGVDPVAGGSDAAHTRDQAAVAAATDAGGAGAPDRAAEPDAAGGRDAPTDDQGGADPGDPGALAPADGGGAATGADGGMEAGEAAQATAEPVAQPHADPDGPDAGVMLQGRPAWDEVRLRPGFCALSMLFSDYDRDGAAELRISNDRHYYVRGGYEQMWEMAPLRELVAEGVWEPLALWGMGIASRDLTGDGRPEVMLTSMGDQVLMVADGDGYVPAPLAWGTYATRPHTGADGRPSTGWHAEFADVDNDGLADLFIAKGNVDQMPDMAMADPNNLLMQGPDGVFREVAAAAGVATAERARGAAFADFDGDGRLDLVVINRRAPLELWRNVSNAGRWLALDLGMPPGPGANTRAVGAVVEVRVGEAVRVHEVTVGGGHASGTALPLHIGLGAAAQAEVRVTWPGVAADFGWVRLDAGAVHRLEVAPHPRHGWIMAVVTASGLASHRDWRAPLP